MGGHDQVLGTDELNAYLSKYRLELDPHLEALVGRSVLKLSQLILLA
jgi:casein kinase II subunit alpha